MLLSDYLVSAFLAEGVSTVFGLLGDGNLAWLAAMDAHPEVTVVHARHEGAAVAMASGYAGATGSVGVASVTCGPGITQIATSLTAAARAGRPVVVFGGETPAAAAFHLQQFDPAPLVRATGAEHLRVSTVEQALGTAARAFWWARSRRGPVVLTMPYDLLEVEQPWTEVALTSAGCLPPDPPRPPDPGDVRALAELLDDAVAPVILAGAGAVAAGCRAELLALAERLDAPLVTTLRAKDWFDGEARDLGVVGAFATDAARERLGGADVVLAFGARLGHYTIEGGYLFPAAQVVQIDAAPAGLVDGEQAADRYLRADAALTARALLDRLGPGSGYRGRPGRPVPGSAPAPGPQAPAEPARSAGNGHRPDGTPPLFEPAGAVAVLDGALPPSLPLVIGIGHFWNFVVAGLHGRDPSRYHFSFDFGVIGQGLPTAIGVSLAAHGRGRPIALIEGDGSLLMNLHELETVARHRLPLLIVVLNDGAYGAEYHRLAARGADPRPAVFGWTDLAAVGSALGLRAHRPADADALRGAIDGYLADPAPTVVDLCVDYRSASPQYQRLFYGRSPIAFGA